MLCLVLDKIRIIMYYLIHESETQKNHMQTVRSYLDAKKRDREGMSEQTLPQLIF